jgi:hypothetical protein
MFYYVEEGHVFFSGCIQCCCLLLFLRRCDPLIVEKFVNLLIIII